MRRTSLAEFGAEPERFLRESQLEDLLVTEGGEPIAVVRGVAFKDAEDLAYERDPEFWKMIAARRLETPIPLEEVERELFAEDPSLRELVEAEMRRIAAEDSATGA